MSRADCCLRDRRRSLPGALDTVEGPQSELHRRRSPSFPAVNLETGNGFSPEPPTPEFAISALIVKFLAVVSPELKLIVHPV